MEIKYKNIVLRDMVESDIDVWILWNTEKTEWLDWDGPDLQSDEPFDPVAFRAEEMQALSRKWENDFRNFFELDAQGVHVGMVSSYPTGTDFGHLSWAEARERGEFWYTLGIVICESKYWCSGYGTNGLTAFCKHFLSHGIRNLRLQTWSGNVRMVRCAEKVGFVECNRFVGNRNIRGGVYDGLTFQLDLDKFHKFLAENP